MAGVSTGTRNLAELHDDLQRWFADREGDPTIRVSAFEENQHSGFSNQTLFFHLERPHGDAVPLVLRMPPAGEGLFPHYDFEMQYRAQTMLAASGVRAVAPIYYEPSREWLGAPFMVLPWIEGHSPNDVTYMLKGWLHDASREVQRTCLESFADCLVSLHTTDTRPFGELLRRPGGSGFTVELEWWHQYLLWAGDGNPPSQMVDAYAWARETCPGNPYPDSVLWNDARLSNAVFADDGTVLGALDWEQASIGPAELDIAYWLATRRQTCEALGIQSDPELPGFSSRSELVERLERGLRRPLHALAWHETFAMVRMGTCTAGTQRVLRLSGHEDHFIMKAPLLPQWALSAME